MTRPQRVLKSGRARSRRPRLSSSPVRARTRRYLSIRWITTAAACALLAALIASVGAISERSARRALTAEIEARLRLEAQNVAMSGAGALLTDFPELTLHPLAKDLMQREPELAFVTVTNAAGHIVGDGDARQIGARLALPGDLRAEARRGAPALSTPASPAQVRLLRNDALLVATAPILLAGNRHIGDAYVGLRRSYIAEKANRAWQSKLLFLAVTLLLGGLATYALMWKLLKPITALRAGIERLGRGELETPVLLDDATEFGMLADALNVMSWELAAAREDLLENERLAHEMELAQSIQQSLLPATRLTEGTFVIEGAQRAAAEVGGDYYDFLRLPDGRIGVAIADVAGKGLGGCMVTSMVSALLKAFSKSHTSPAALLGALDRCLADLLPRATFVTMFYAIVDPESGDLVYSSAGHNPCLIYRKRTGTIERTNRHGAPLCLVRGNRVPRTLQDNHVRLEPGDLLLQTTDGVNEAFDVAADEQFGFARVEGILQRTGAEGAAAVLAALREALDEWRGDGAISDDETLLAVSREGAPAPAPDDLPTAASSTDALVAEARKRGQHLSLVARFDALGGLDGWLHGLPGLAALPARDFQGIHLALYELCANVAEHGYAGEPDAEQHFDLWWVPEPVRRVAGDGLEGRGAGPASPPPGHFLIVDRGKPFAPPSWIPTDYGDRQVRRRGRGHGLDIVQRLASVEFFPATPVGNVTVLWMRSDAHSRKPEEVVR